VVRFLKEVGDEMLIHRSVFPWTIAWEDLGVKDNQCGQRNPQVFGKRSVAGNGRCFESTEGFTIERQSRGQGANPFGD